jgi:hypothetical protein
MSSLLTCIVIFILFMAAGYAGLQVQSNLAPEHKTDATKGSSVGWRGWSAYSWRSLWEPSSARVSPIIRARGPIWRTSPPRFCGLSRR